MKFPGRFFGRYFVLQTKKYLKEEENYDSFHQ